MAIIQLDMNGNFTARYEWQLYNARYEWQLYNTARYEWQLYNTGYEWQLYNTGYELAIIQYCM